MAANTPTIPASSVSNSAKNAGTLRLPTTGVPSGEAASTSSQEARTTIGTSSVASRISTSEIPSAPTE